MAMYRKLGRKSDVRRALLRSQATALIANGKIITTEARAKEVRKYVEPLIAMAAREKDNFETVTVTAKVAKKDANGKRVKEERDGKKVVVYDEVQKEIKKDKPSRMNARRKIQSVLYGVTEVGAKKRDAKKVSTSTARSTLSVTAATPGSSRSARERATQRWKSCSSLSEFKQNT